MSPYTLPNIKYEASESEQQTYFDQAQAKVGCHENLYFWGSYLRGRRLSRFRPSMWKGCNLKKLDSGGSSLIKVHLSKNQSFLQVTLGDNK